MCICDTPLKGVMTHRLRTRALEVTVMCKKKKKNSQNEDFSPPPPASSLIFKLKGHHRFKMEIVKVLLCITGDKHWLWPSEIHLFIWYPRCMDF